MLTKIKDLFKLDYESRTTYATQTEFQVVHMLKNETDKLSEGELFSLTLADKEYSYGKFIYMRKDKSPKLEIGHYINITRVCPMLLGQKKERAFLIKELLVVNKESKSIIKSPPYQDKIKNRTPSKKYGDLGNIYNSRYTPLQMLTTFTKDPLLLVRVVSKGQVKQYKSGKGQLFAFVMMDELDYKMEAICFGSTAAKFFEQIAENNIYEIHGGEVRNTDKKYDNTRADYRLVLNDYTKIVAKSEGDFLGKKADPSDVFSSISEIHSLENNTLVNLLCVVVDKGAVISKETKVGSMLMRKTMVIDLTKQQIELTLWKNFAELAINNGDVLLIRRARVGDFGGRNLTTVNESKIIINPKANDPIFHSVEAELRNLEKFSSENDLQKGPNSAIFKSEIINMESKKKDERTYNDRIVYIYQIMNEMDKLLAFDIHHRFPFYKIRATISHLEHNEKNFYPGCVNKDCNKKVSWVNNSWICEKCHLSFANPKYYYALNIRIKDASCEHFVDIFGRCAENLMQMRADEYRKILIDRDDSKLQQISGNIEFNDFYFLLKVRGDEYNQLIKKKFTAIKIERIDSKIESRRLLSDLV